MGRRSYLSSCWLFVKLRSYLQAHKSIKTSGYAMVVHGRPKTPKNTIFWGHLAPGVVQPLYSRGHITCVYSLIEIGSKTAEKNSAQTNRQTDTTKIMVTWPWTNNQLRPNPIQVSCQNPGVDGSHNIVFLSFLQLCDKVQWFYAIVQTSW